MRLHVALLCKHGKWIKLLLRVETLGDPKNIVLDASANFAHRFNAAFTKLPWPWLIVCLLHVTMLWLLALNPKMLAYGICIHVHEVYVIQQE